MSSPRVVIENDRLLCDGKPLRLWGGELQYFRVRSRDFDARSTQRMWAQTLERMAELGMNLVTTYVPWDYHEPVEGQFEFTGAKDLRHFLELCYEKGFYVQLKPGPYITAEWPRGWTSFGALPEWLPDRIPDALVRTPSGKPFSYHPFRPRQGRQCAYHHPDFLRYVGGWFSQVARIIQPYLREKSCIVMLQLDNETNLFWRSHYQVDYSETALRGFRDALRSKYQKIEHLNHAYGSHLSDFEEVFPPVRPPSGSKVAGPENIRHEDWFEAAHVTVETYLRALKAMWEERGIREEDVLFTTNDTLQVPPLPSKSTHILFSNMRRKGQVGLFTLDSYPKFSPFHRALFDRPFLPDFNVHTVALFAPEKVRDCVFAAEIQGGLFPIGPLKVSLPPRYTTQLLCKLFGHGVRGGSLYVIRDGLNKDGSAYSYQAALDEAGRPSSRFEALRGFGRLLSSSGGERMLRSIVVESDVALCVDSDAQCALEGSLSDERHLWGHQYAAWFGLLLQAGFHPRLLDLAQEDVPWEGMKAGIVVTSGILRESVARNLLSGLEQGKSLMVSPCWPRWGPAGRLGPFAREFVERILPMACLGSLHPRALHYDLGGVSGTLKHGGRMRGYHIQGHGTPFLWPRGERGCACGLTFPLDKGTLVLLGLDLAREYASWRYFHCPDRERWERRRLLRSILESFGVLPTLTWQDVRATVWARNAGDGAFMLFCIHDADAPHVTVRCVQPDRLGIRNERAYQVTEILNGGPPLRASGAELVQEGVRIPLNSHGVAIALVEPVSPACHPDSWPDPWCLPQAPSPRPQASGLWSRP